MKKVTLVFKNIFCDFCSYEIEEVLGKLPEIKSFEIHRKINSVDIYLEKLNKLDRKNLELLFSEDNLQLVEVIGGET